MTIEEQIRLAVAEGVSVALADLNALAPMPELPSEAEGWRSRIHRVHADTRLNLAEVAEALGVSERSVRRYMDGSGERPALPARRGPTGTTVTAGDLVQWIKDVEGGERFRSRTAS